MQDIFDALPDAASQLSEIVTLLFTSGIGYIVVPFLFVELLVIIFKVGRGKDD